MERVFNNAVGMENTHIDNDGDPYALKVRRLIEDSVSYEEEYLARARDENTKYYYGKYPTLDGNDVANAPYDSFDERSEDYAPNRSTIVSTDVKDTVMTIMPSLMRIFTGSENPVNFQPSYAEQTEIAAQQTQYVNHVLMEDNEGFTLIHNVCKDVLTVKYAAVNVRTDNSHEVIEQTFQNITQEQLQTVIYEAPDVEIVEAISNEEDPEIIDLLVLRYTKSKPEVRIEAIPPEEFRISRFAKDAKTSRLIGWDRVETRSEMIKRGYPEELLGDSAPYGSNEYSDERYMRNRGLTSDVSMEDGVLFGEWYIRVDQDGDGIDELRYIATLGPDRTIVEDYAVPCAKMVLFTGDPTPHTAIGESIADAVKDIQKIKTNVIRGILDNLAEANNPKTVVNELLVNIDDALNDEMGAVIRTRGNVNDTVGFSKTPFIGKDSMEIVNYLDNLRASRTGVTEASKGLDPDAMQSTALAGVNAIIEGAQERIELIARILAETGLKELYKVILREVTDNPNPDRTIQVNGKWVDMPLSLFDPTLRCKVNPNMGRGSDMVRMQALQTIGAYQKEILGQFGIKNNVVTPNHALNTLADIMEMSNIRNTDRYFTYMSEQELQALKAEPNEPSPELLLAQAELEKVKKDLIIADAKIKQAEADQQFRIESKALDDDFRRDKLGAETAIKAAQVIATAKNALNSDDVAPAPHLVNTHEG